MLFQSPGFLFVFLPLVLIGYAVARRLADPRALIGWLILSSLVFYAQWQPKFVWLIVGSTTLNYGLGRWLGATADHRRHRRGILALGLGINLAVLGYFKYRGFFAQTVDALAGIRFDPGAVVLPLGISFFSFQKIAYLIDVHRGTAPEKNFARYFLFVVFFPQLIAGPIVHPGEILPQMRTAWSGPVEWDAVRRGTVFFVIGLAKKVLLADGISPFLGTTFDAAAHGGSVGGTEAWSAALGYTLQLYFDFSGYTDMAIGLGLFFNIRLPFNFDRPYRSHSIQEFWQRWHMTLSRFIRDYVYIPMGGNRGGLPNHLRNLLLTMLVAGLWHGAGWTFVLWGGVHGIYLVIHDLWKRWAGGDGAEAGPRPFWTLPLTFVAVVAAWVLFRADSLAAAGRLYAAMAGVHGWGSLPHGNLVGWLIGGTAIIFLAPTTQQWAGMAPEGAPQWRSPLPRSRSAAGLLALLAFFSLRAIFSEPSSEFIYFNF